MRTAMLITTLLLTACVGSPTPRNPMEKPDGISGIGSDIWWQRSTVGVNAEDNPWEAFNQPEPTVDPLDPWSGFEQPQIFPDDWQAVPREDMAPTPMLIPTIPSNELDEV